MSASRPDNAHGPPAWRRPASLAWTAAALIAVFYLLREHGGHVLGWWPYLLLVLCPLMHLLHGHGQHASHHGHQQDEA
ncbi:MAG: DUF2933 domain-containing protein [Hydrogenophaga sp.]|jgi:hypothetical protein|nr:DUF2933 domain-containing protein [Hydrogenophaga sp.]